MIKTSTRSTTLQGSSKAVTTAEGDRALTQIRGIGTTKRQWLRSLGIHTIDDLAQANVAELANQLRNQKHSIPQQDLQNWIDQAQVQCKNLLESVNHSVELGSIAESVIESTAELTIEFTLESNRKSTEISSNTESVKPAVELIEPGSGQNKSETDGIPCETGKLDAHLLPSSTQTIQPDAAQQNTDDHSESTGNANALTNSSISAFLQEDWEPALQFTVTIQRRQQAEQVEWRTVVQTPTSKAEIWPGVMPEPLQEWGRSHLHNSQPQPPAARLRTPIEVAIAELRVSQPTWFDGAITTDAVQHLFPMPLSSEAPFSLEVPVQWGGLERVESGAITYRIQAQARQRATGKTFFLGEVTSTLQPDPSVLPTNVLKDLSLPQAGAYSLTVTVTVVNAPAIPQQFKVPLLQMF